MPRDERQPKTSLVMPILLISIGALFLLRNWIPGLDLAHVFKTYWPLILIMVGLGKIWDYSRSRAPGGTSSGAAVGSTIGVVAFVLVLVALLGHYQKSRRHGQAGDEFSQHASQIVETRDLQGAKSVEVGIYLGGGQLNVSGGSAHLLNAEFHFDRNFDAPTVDYHVTGDQGFLDIRQEKGGVNFGPSDNTWDLNFSDQTPIELKVEMGAGQGNLKLRDMNITNAELHMGAGQVLLDLTGPRKSNLNVSIKGGVGQVTVRLPKDVGVSAHAAGGIGAISADGLHKDGSQYTNDAFGKSPQSIRLDVQGGIGEIELIQEP